MADDKVNRTESEWRDRLDDQQYQVTRCSGTERPFTGKYWDCKDAGTYKCVCCGQELFRSESKYDSGTGWPSFSQPTDAGARAPAIESVWSSERYRNEFAFARPTHFFGVVN